MAAWRRSGEPSRTAPRVIAAYTRSNLAHKEEGDMTKLTRGSGLTVVRRSDGIPVAQARLDGACAGIPRARGVTGVEVEVEGAPDSKAEPRRRLAVAGWRWNRGTTAALVPCSNSGNAAVLC